MICSTSHSSPCILSLLLTILSTLIMYFPVKISLFSDYINCQSYVIIVKLYCSIDMSPSWDIILICSITVGMSSHNSSNCDLNKCCFIIKEVPSVLWHCWLGIKKSIQPIKIEWRGAGVDICLERGANCLHMVQLMPLPSPNPIISCLILIQTGSTCLVPAYPGCPGKEAVKRV